MMVLVVQGECETILSGSAPLVSIFFLFAVEVVGRC